MYRKSNTIRCFGTFFFAFREKRTKVGKKVLEKRTKTVKKSWKNGQKQSKKCWKNGQTYLRDKKKHGILRI
ncbi:hypothetical protein HMPREF0373_00529 [Eubacterium ramulus ATCC 29099]|uniref:Uncharacterized protein n=1 Tax=Eubacterium ramulus ATCC 29099 TaxID=1256908 RepID=U2RB06_EUBRA|nr:hypothetical protein HMPREF0373_00529 [Eubacterium ramulus ATCC 29099]